METPGDRESPIEQREIKAMNIGIVLVAFAVVVVVGVLVGVYKLINRLPQDDHDHDHDRGEDAG